MDRIMGEKLLTLNNGISHYGYKLEINDTDGTDNNWVYSSFPENIYLLHWDGRFWTRTLINGGNNNWNLFYEKLPFIDEIMLVDNRTNGTGTYLRCRNLFKTPKWSHYSSPTDYTLWFFERSINGDANWEWKANTQYDPIQAYMTFSYESGQNIIRLANASSG